MTSNSTWYAVGQALRELLGLGRGKVANTASGSRQPKPVVTGKYPGDFVGRFEIGYTPVENQAADPGEVIWTWVPYEEDYSKGKDRPVVVVGRDGAWLLAVPMTSKDHDRDASQEAAEGRYWLDIGAGSWDRSGRPSEVRVDRVIRVDPDTVRRVAARLDKQRFAAVAAGIAKHW